MKEYLKIFICAAIAIFFVWLLSPIVKLLGFLLGVIVFTFLVKFGIDKLCSKYNWKWWE